MALKTWAELIDHPSMLLINPPSFVCARSSQISCEDLFWHYFSELMYSRILLRVAACLESDGTPVFST